MGVIKLKRLCRAAFRRMPDTGIFQVQLALDAAAGFVIDFTPAIDLGDAAAFRVQELQLQRGGPRCGAEARLPSPAPILPLPAYPAAPAPRRCWRGGR